MSKFEDLFDLSKPIKDNSGRPVRIICTDAKGNRPIVGLVGEQEGTVFTYFEDGTFSDTGSNANLVPNKTRTLYFNAGDGYGSAIGARACYDTDWAVVAVEFDNDDKVVDVSLAHEGEVLV